MAQYMINATNASIILVTSTMNHVVKSLFYCCYTYRRREVYENFIGFRSCRTWNQQKVAWYLFHGTTCALWGLFIDMWISLELMTNHDIQSNDAFISMKRAKNCTKRQTITVWLFVRVVDGCGWAHTDDIEKHHQNHFSRIPLLKLWAKQLHFISFLWKRDLFNTKHQIPWDQHALLETCWSHHQRCTNHHGDAFLSIALSWLASETSMTMMLNTKLHRISTNHITFW